MKVLVLGANGATGFEVVKQLLEHGIAVRVIARNIGKLVSLGKQDALEIIEAGIVEIEDTKLLGCITGIDAVISCLGHNISFRGIFGKPHNLVTDAIMKVCKTIQMNNGSPKIKLILMNTTACLNPETHEEFSKAEKVIITILRFLLPPQNDNEKAASYLRNTIGKNDQIIEWIAVRPDALINEESITNYKIYSSPVRSPIFNSGKTSRINVANFMLNLLMNQEQWEKWKYMMPVIYNEEETNNNQA